MKHGVHIPTKRIVPPSPDKEVLRRMYHEDLLSTSQIGRALGISSEMVREHLIKHGIPRRNVGSQHGHLNPSWNGGKTIDKTGYILLYMPDYPSSNCNGYVREHRFVMEQQLGRLLTKSEVVHHIDGNRSNNSPHNLELFDKNANHLRHELTGKAPQWSEDGRARIAVASKKGTDASRHQPWTDERREKARQRMKARQAAGSVARYVWTPEAREQARLRAMNRDRLPDGSFGGKKQSRPLENDA